MDQASIDAAIASIIKGDEERLKKRRETPALSQLETADQILPLKGSFFDFALEYYKESQMRVNLSFPFSSPSTSATETCIEGNGDGRAWKRRPQPTRLATSTQRVGHYQDPADEASCWLALLLDH